MIISWTTETCIKGLIATFDSAMETASKNQWAHTAVAFEVFMNNFKCLKCNMNAREPTCYLKCDHLFCTLCIESRENCPKCQSLAKRNEVRSDTMIPKLISYGNSIAQIVKEPKSPEKKVDETPSLNMSVQDLDTSLMVQNIPKDINKPNRKGETKLHKACIKPNVDAVRSLLKAGANPNTKDFTNWPPLHEAISFGLYEIAELLLEAGAIPDTPGYEHRTALHEAVLRDDIEMVKLVKRFIVDTNARDHVGKTALDYAKSDAVRQVLTEDIKSSDSVLERTFMSTNNSMYPMNNSFTGNGTHVFGLNLTSESRSLLTKLGNKHKIKIAKTYTSAVTHVIVETNYQCVSPVSYEILLAILHGKWILNSQWIKYCMDLTDLSTMDLACFEVQGTTGAPDSGVPSRAREIALKQHPRLFNGCYFFFAMTNMTTYELGDLEFTKSSLSKLVIAGEGKVLNREPNPETIEELKEIPFHVANAPNHPLHRCSHYIIYMANKDEPGIRYNMPHIRSLPLIWLIESIERFELLDPTYIGM